ncbi:hypothetical protein [Chryseobacterium sp. MFBS3-17]|uniref:hypothetical protein n=1 Tax=Chryseobacterium sp. MFBS3-17 TaxID=2886689 RepID=UPI001D0E3A57|nr:hypothetical protein [Chryseobacterium sp. MFBS3-17]MCC2590364.1 hypothetical protein [Chryseobacterium sp. MFBS3-17]
MNDKVAQLKRNLQRIIAANPNLPVDGVVQAVTGDVCTVLVGDLELSDVRLKPTADGEDHLLIIPKTGSRVLMLSADGSIGNLTVIKCDVAEKIIYNENGLQVEIDSTTGKVNVANNVTSLKDLFEQLADILKTLKVYTPAGPSGPPLPDTVAKIVMFENDFKTILK